MVEDAAALSGPLRQAGAIEPVGPVAMTGFAPQQDVIVEIGGRAQRNALQQGGAGDHGVGFSEKQHGVMLLPSRLIRHAASDGDVEAAAQFVMQRGGGRHHHLHVGAPLVKPVEARDQPAHGETGRRADSQYMADRQMAAGFGGGDHAVEGQADFLGEGARRRGRGHAPPGPHEQPVSQPVLQRRYLPADGAMGQAELGAGLGITGGAGGNLEDAQGVERGKTAHGLVREVNNNREKSESSR